MCELFAMSSSLSSTVNYSLFEFAKHGGLIHHNLSGWGIAYYADHDAYLIKVPQPAADSPWVRFVAEQKLASHCVLAHVRRASVGAPMLQNTHPFRMAMGGRTHMFAHNGTLHGLADAAMAQGLSRRPVGDTDSELAFCALIERLDGIWEKAGGIPALDDRFAIFTEFAAEAVKLGPSNFLYSDSDALFVHGHKRRYEAGDGESEARPPGLHIRDCTVCEPVEAYESKGLRVELADQRTVMFASVPLDECDWEPLPEGTAIAVRNGVEQKRATTI